LADLNSLADKLIFFQTHLRHDTYNTAEEEQLAAIRLILTEGLAAAAAQQRQQAPPPEIDQRPPGWQDSEVEFIHPDLDISFSNGEAVTVGLELASCND